MRIAKHIILTILLVVATIPVVTAQVDDDAPKMRKLRGEELVGTLTPQQHKKGLWGYVNEEKKFIIRPVFEEVFPFEGNVARVCSEGKWGIIGRNGLYVVSPAYDEVKEFSVDSLAIIGEKIEGMSNARYGLIDSRGSVRQVIAYDIMEMTPYGYLAQRDLKYSTINKEGVIIHDKEFDAVRPLDKENVVDMFFKDGKWGMIKDGKDILAHKWDEELKLLYDNNGPLPNFYIGKQGNYFGVVSSEGKFVAPCYFDSISLHMSGKYFVTMRNGKYGALSLKMSEIVPPILDDIPVIGESIYPVYDGYNFWCANINGRFEFRVYADVYNARDPEGYIKTTEYPEWAKTTIIEDNLMNRNNEIEAARQLCAVMAKRDYDVNIAKFDPNSSKDIEMSFPQDDNSRYGVIISKKFASGRGVVDCGEDLQLNVIQKSSDMTTFVATDDLREKLYIVVANTGLLSINEALDKFNVKSCDALYVKEYFELSDNRFMVVLAFVRTARESEQSLIETDPYNLPVSNANIKIFEGTPNPSNESYGIITFDVASRDAISFAQINARDNRIIVSNWGGFYVCSSQTLITDESNTISRYDKNGLLEWTFRAEYSDVLLDMDETENFTYLCGYTKDGKSERPLILQIDKYGRQVGRYTKEYLDSRFSGIKCANYLIYAKFDGVAKKQYGGDYYPHFVLEDLGDNMYVRPHCAWVDWGGKMIGGCGLISAGGKWIQSPIIYSEDVCNLYNWEFSSFTDEYLIVRYNGKCGIIDRKGELVVYPKYEALEHLDNSSYFKASNGFYHGVIDASGRIIVPIEYDYIGRMREDIIVARKDGVYGCFDKSGRNIVPFEYQEIKEYVGGMARICEKGRYGFIDKDGEKIVSPYYDAVENFSEGCAKVVAKGKAGFVKLNQDSGSVKEEWVVFPMYEAAGSFSCGLAPLCQGGKYGFINKSGEFIVPARYDFADEFNPEHKIARVSNLGKWGIVDIYGSEIVEPKYDEVIICADGYIYVKDNNKCGILSVSGKEIYPTVCDDKIEYSSSDNLFKHGIAYVTIDGKRVSVDQFGNIITLYIPK